ncbi:MULTISPECIES: hypothetical protein [Enterobacterales]|uniref:hypothetical protein n=1 Tax=Enterobacterales TaxID=91347 RepID=UPI002ED97E5E
MSYSEFEKIISDNIIHHRMGKRYDHLEECFYENVSAISAISQMVGSVGGATWLWACISFIHRVGGGGPGKYLTEDDSVAGAWGSLAIRQQTGRHTVNQTRFENWLKADSWGVFYTETLKFFELAKVRHARFSIHSLFDVARLRTMAIDGSDDTQLPAQRFKMLMMSDFIEGRHAAESHAAKKLYR